MANTRVSPLEITRNFLKYFHNQAHFTANISDDYEKNWKAGGYEGQKIGPTLNIRDPLMVNTRKTWAMTQQDIKETYHSLTIDTVNGEDLNFSDADMATTVTDFMPRYIEGPAKKLASTIDQQNITAALAYIPNCEAYSGLAVPTAMNQGYLTLKAKMHKALVDENDEVFAMINPDQEAAMLYSFSGMLNPTMEISDIFKKGQLTSAYGLTWYRSALIPSITCGSETNTSPVVGTFVAATNTSLPYSAASAATATWKAGQVITIAGLYDINYETKSVYNQLKQFVITADNTASGSTGTLTVFPAINFDTTSPTQNCYILGGSINGVAIVLGALAGASTAVATTASTTYQQNLLWVRDAFAYASVPLEKPNGLDMAETVTVDGFSFRFLRGFDMINGRFLSRIDHFHGFTELRGVWAGKLLTI